MRSRTLSPQTVAVLLTLAADPTAWQYGYVLCRQTGLKAGSLYPILMRLADRGMLETAWEHDAPAGRPARHLYRLSGQGLEAAVALAAPPVRQTAPAQLHPRLEGA